MPTRSRTTFKKRQKELARMEKQRDKAAKRMERKLGHTRPSDTEATEPAAADETATGDLSLAVNEEQSDKALT